MKLKKLLAVLLLMNIFICTGPAYAEKGEIVIGLIPEMNIFQQMDRFRPLSEYLSEKTGVKIKLTILSKYGGVIKRFREHQLDGAFFGSFTGAAAIEILGVEPIARPVNLDGSSTYHGYIFVRKDSNIRKVSDMKGKKMVFVAKATTAGYVFPIAYFKENGVDNINSFFSEYYFSGSHDSAIYAVLDKKADIGAAKHSVYDRVRLSDPRIESELLIIAESVKVPSNGLCVRKDLNKLVKKKLKEALLNIDKDPKGKAALEAFGAIRFIETTASDYKPVFELLKRANITADMAEE